MRRKKDKMLVFCKKAKARKISKKNLNWIIIWISNHKMFYNRI
jgi:hypothetical protein